MAEIPIAPVKRLLNEGSHGCRISATAADLAAVHLSNMAHLLGDKAGQYALADKRKTIMDQDINKAWSDLTKPV